MWGSSLRVRSIRAAVVVLVLATALLLALATSAFALNTAVWSGATPAAGAIVLVKPTAPIVVADDTAPITKATVTMNGSPASFVNIEFFVGHSYYDEEAESDVWVVDDWTKARITGYFSANRILAGTNTIVTTVTSSKGVSTYTRSFNYGSVTTISSVSPGTDAILPASPPAISVALSSGASSFTSVMSLDGVVVPTTYVAATKTFTHTPAVALSPGSHTVAFTALDSSGGSVSRTWKFTVSPPMSNGSDCQACHTNYPTAHPTADCSKCHDHAYAPAAGTHGGEIPTAAGCSGDGGDGQDDACHDLDHRQDGIWGIWGAGPFACADCHSATYPDVARHTDTGTMAAHVSATSCEGTCHSTNLVTEHGKYPTSATIKYQCTLCHGPSARADVKTAVDAGNTACDACHPLDTGHEALHATTVPADCAGSGCHAGTSLTSIHINSETALDCDSCHESTDADVVDAILTGDKGCDACHDAQPHPNMDAKHTSPTNATCFGTGCHDNSKSLPTVHAAYAGPGSENPEYANTCALCHANPTINVRTSGAACTGACHSGTTHSNMNAGHAVTAASSACTSCHGTDVNTVHGAYADLTKCATCHSQPDNWTKSGDCANCHSLTTPHPDQAAAHAATAIGSGDIVMGLSEDDHSGGIVINEPCDRCHITDLSVQHANQCQYCHTGGGAPSAPGGTWNRTCQQGSCHPTIHAATLTTTDHFGSYWNSSVSCDSCHDGGDPWPGSGDNCNGCHSAGATIPDHIAPTASSNVLGSYNGEAVITISAADTGGSGLAGVYHKLDLGGWQSGSTVTIAPPVGGTATHTLQYYATDVAGNMSAIQSATFGVTGSGPADTEGPTGTMTISNDAPFVNNGNSYITASMTDAGSGIYAQSVDPGTGTFGGWGVYTPSLYVYLAGANGPKTVRVQYKDYAGNITTKTDTVTLDTSPPITTTTAIHGGTYYGNQTFTFSATDSLSGVQKTWIQLDEQAPYYGTSVEVPAPATGSVRHVVYYYSIDNAGNQGYTQFATLYMAAAVPTYTLTYSAGANGTISGTTPQTVNHNGSGTAVTAVANTGYHFVSWSDGVTTASRTDSGVTANKSVTASFAVNTYTLTYSAGANGTISGTTPQTVNHNGSGTAVTAVANTGYHFVSWSDGVTTASRTDSGVTASKSVTASFAANASFTITALAGTGGSITPAGAVSVASGASQTFTIAPQSGYVISQVVVDGTNQGAISSYTFSGVTAPHAISATFVETGGGGTVQTTALNIDGFSYVDANESASGAWATYAIYVNDALIGTKLADADPSWSCPEIDLPSGGHIDIVVDCGFDYYDFLFAESRPNSYTLTLPAGTTRLEASTWTGFLDKNVTTDYWEPYDDMCTWVDVGTTTIGNIKYTGTPVPTYTLTYSAGTNGTISGTTPQTVNHNGSGTAVTAVANTGYHFVSWSDGITTASRTDSGVTANKSVTASFAINTYTLTYSAGANGTVSGTTPQTVSHNGSGTAVTAIANSGYHFVSWSDGVTTATRTDSSVTANKSVTASFAINTYTLTYSAGANGTVSGTTPQTVSHNGSGTAVTAVANAGYHFVSWSDGITTASRTDSGVTANKSVTASFAINTYTLTYSAGANGTITGTTPQTVNHNGSGTAVTAVANAGYHFVSWSDGITTAMRTDSGVTASKSVTASFAADLGGTVQTTALNIDGFSYVDANESASGAWATYAIYVNDALIGTKIADADPSWSCPEIDLPSGGHIDIVVDCGFDYYDFLFAESRPNSYTLTLPAGTTRLEASTWTGFLDKNVTTDYWEPYDDMCTWVDVGTTTIGNIVVRGN